jgi:hypothetical protein
MLQSISSPRAEGASPPLKDVPYSKKAVTLSSLQLHAQPRSLHLGSCSLRDTPGSFLSGGHASTMGCFGPEIENVGLMVLVTVEPAAIAWLGSRRG